MLYEVERPGESMKRIRVRSFFVGILLVIALSCLEPSHAAEPKHPNIVILLADDMGYGEVHGLNPDRGKIPTPNLDRLISDGMIFTDAHTAASVCTPSRYALLTGRYCWRTRLQKGVVTGGKPCLIKKDRLTIGKMLKSVGYHTAMTGKWHLDFQVKDNTILDGPITRGFDTWFGFHHARSMDTLYKDGKFIEKIKPIEMLPKTTDFAVDYINDRAEAAKQGSPFFLYVAFGSPHSPIVPTEEWKGKSGLGDYGDFVMMTDGMAGKIIDAIDQNGLTDNTIIIFSADNGTSSKSSGLLGLLEQGHYPSAHLRGYKADLWEGGHRVPFILRWPGGGVNAGSECGDTVGLVDMTATIAELIGYDISENMAEDSVSFLPALTGQPVESERAAIVHHSFSGKFSIRKGKWKLLLAPGSGGWSSPTDAVATKEGLPEIQLYDMDADVSETTNLQDKYPEVVKELIELLKTYVDNGRSTKGVQLKNDVASIDLYKKNEGGIKGKKKGKKRKK